MTRTVVELTSAWQQIASGQAIIEIKKKGNGTISVNSSASDTAASVKGINEIKEGDQYLQTSTTADTFAKGEGWEVIVDQD